MNTTPRRTASALAAVLGVLALGLGLLGCSPAYVEFLVNARSCDFGKVYEVVYEFKDNPTADPMNGPMIVRGGQQRTVSMFPPGAWTRERVDVSVYELPDPAAPNGTKRLVRKEVLTVELDQPPPVLTVCAGP